MQERFSGGFDSPLGKIRIEALNGKITLLIFENQRFAPESAAVCRKGAEGDRGGSEDKTGSGASEYAVKSAIRWLEEYFSGAVPSFTPPLSFEGATAFRRKVWDRLLLIPYGKTATYGEIAATNWNIGAGVVAAIAFVVVGGTFGSYMLLVVGQRRLRPTVAGMYNYIQPMVASIVAIYWGMDSFSISKLVAAILIFAGVYMVTVSSAEKSRKQQSL